MERTMKNLTALPIPAESGIHVFVSMSENGIKLAIIGKIAELT